MSLISPGAIFNESAILDTVRIMMCPVNQSAELIPLVHTPELDTVSESHRHPLCNVYVVSNKERLPIADIENKALVPRAILVIRQQALHEARCLDPAA